MTYEEFDSLPPHLLKLVSLLAVAKSNQAIADELVLSVGTVEQYVSELKQRLGATDRAAWRCCVMSS